MLLASEGRPSDAFIQNTDDSDSCAHELWIHYRLFEHACGEGVGVRGVNGWGGIRPNNSCSGSANPLSHPYQLSVSGMESELNIQFAQFNPSSEMGGWGGGGRKKVLTPQKIK